MNFKHFLAYTLIIMIFSMMLGIVIFKAIEVKTINEVKIINFKILKGKYHPKTIPQSREEIVENCKDLDVIQTSICLRDNVITFYNYSRRVDEPQSFERLQKFGGDCFDYALLYQDLGTMLGFDVQMVEYTGYYKAFSSHSWTAIWNDEENIYCFIDQTEVKCREKLDYENQKI